MPKETFYNLPESKRKFVLEAVKKEFEEHSIKDASVKDIVSALGISRGSFYTYFENLEESYFAILELETIETHELFLGIYRKEEKNLFKTLDVYGQELAGELFKKEKYALYKNRYLYWSAELDALWKNFYKRNGNIKRYEVEMELRQSDDKEMKEVMHYIKAVVHELIKRAFLEKWDRQVFLEHYENQISWMKNGLKSTLK
ncbi:MAG TPA: TetR family transcriptional regulator [Proteiniclasticum sp.]|nr:TetR family transcriptional regulator [Proteiniclasticum sp.]